MIEFSSQLDQLLDQSALHTKMTRWHAEQQVSGSLTIQWSLSILKNSFQRSYFTEVIFLLLLPV